MIMYWQAGAGEEEQKVMTGVGDVKSSEEVWPRVEGIKE